MKRQSSGYSHIHWLLARRVYHVENTPVSINRFKLECLCSCSGCDTGPVRHAGIGHGTPHFPCAYLDPHSHTLTHPYTRTFSLSYPDTTSPHDSRDSGTRRRAAFRGVWGIDDLGTPIGRGAER